MNIDNWVISSVETVFFRDYWPISLLILRILVAFKACQDLSSIRSKGDPLFLLRGIHQHLAGRATLSDTALDTPTSFSGQVRGTQQ